MTTTCARCGAEVGDAAACPQCGKVLRPSPAPSPATFDWRTDTAERPPCAVLSSRRRGDARAAALPDVRRRGRGDRRGPRGPDPPAPHPTGPDRLDDAATTTTARRRSPAWLPWAILALVMVLVAAGGIWLLLSPVATRARPTTRHRPCPSRPREANTSRADRRARPRATLPPAETVECSDHRGPRRRRDQATATAPRTAPPNEDAFGNRTTYVAANMLDGSPTTCWRMAGAAPAPT